MTSNNQTLKKAPLYRQLFAMFYDAFLIIAMLFIASAILIYINHGQAFNQHENPLYSLYLATLIFIFYAWFWRKGGQTLGMRVWKVKIIHDLGFYPHWHHSLLRLFFPLLVLVSLGEGYWWPLALYSLSYVWFLAFGYTWQDKISSTQIIDVREAKAAKSSS